MVMRDISQVCPFESIEDSVCPLRVVLIENMFFFQELEEKNAALQAQLREVDNHREELNKRLMAKVGVLT